MNIVDYHHSNNNSQSGLTKYDYMCDECGEVFRSLDEYIEHYKRYHPRSIGTAIS
jgi:C2H2-type zinc finger